MTQEQRGQIAFLITKTAKYYSKQIDKEVISMMVDDLSDLDFGLVANAYSEYRKNPKNKFFPLPAQIREIIFPEIDDRFVAIELARKIDKCISKYGYVWEQGCFNGLNHYWQGNGKICSSFKEAVLSELGELGWHTICSRGGWLATRNSANEMEEGQFIAQMRDQILASITLQKQGIDIAQIEMPKHKSEISDSELINNMENALDLIRKEPCKRIE